MRIIDAFTGQEVRVGERVLEDRFFIVRGLIEARGERMWLPFHVRFTHPKYMFQRVAIVPT